MSIPSIKVEKEKPQWLVAVLSIWIAGSLRGRVDVLSVNRGFTLIEIMVTVAVFSLLVMAISPSLNDWMINLRIRNAASALERGLQLARQEAIRRNRSTSFWLVSSAASDDHVLDNTCQLSASSGSWVVSSRTPAGNCSAEPSVTQAPMLVAKHAIGDGSRNVVVSALGSAGASTTVTFNGLGHITNSDAISVIAVKADASSGNYRNMCVEISGVGTAQICDPALDSSKDPRACKRDDCKNNL